MKELVNVFIPKVSENKFLAIARASTDKYFSNMFALPGGGVEPGENHLAAAKREFLEETGVKLTTITEEPVLISILNVFGQEVKLFVYEGAIISDDFHPQDSDISAVLWIEPPVFIESLIKSGYPENEIPKFKNFLTKKGFTI